MNRIAAVLHCLLMIGWHHHELFWFRVDRALARYFDEPDILQDVEARMVRARFRLSLAQELLRDYLR